MAMLATAGVVHRVGGEARRSVDVTIAALERSGRNVRRCRHAGRSRAVVAARAVGVGRRMGEGGADPASRCSEWQLEHSAVVATWPVLLPWAPDVPWLLNDAVVAGAAGDALTAAWLIV